MRWNRPSHHALHRTTHFLQDTLETGLRNRGPKVSCGGLSRQQPDLMLTPDERLPPVPKSGASPAKKRAPPIFRGASQPAVTKEPSTQTGFPTKKRSRKSVRGFSFLGPHFFSSKRTHTHTHTPIPFSLGFTPRPLPRPYAAGHRGLWCWHRPGLWVSMAGFKAGRETKPSGCSLS